MTENKKVQQQIIRADLVLKGTVFFFEEGTTERKLHPKDFSLSIFYSQVEGTVEGIFPSMPSDSVAAETQRKNT